MCLEPMDIMGHHALKCCRGWDGCQHHNTLRDCFAEYAHKGSLVAKVEALGLTDGNSQPADVYLPSLPGGPACLDFTVICASQARLLSGLVEDPLHAVKDSKAQKKRKHRKACAEHQLQFVPMSVNHWGIWGKESEAAFEHVARAYAAAVGKSRRKVRSTICADLNSLLAVANAHMLAKRVPL